jgi:fructose-1,6-bisphosphatase/inositol monophosphatase family enzyme
MYVGAEGTLRAYAVSSEQPFQSRRVGNKIRLQLDGEFVPSFDLFQQDKGVDFVKKGGSIALNMVHCAFGLYDGMLDYTKNKGNVWDVAAGYYFLKQRDYLVLDKDGQKFEVHHPQNGLVALHPKVAPYVLNLTGLTK